MGLFSRDTTVYVSSVMYPLGALPPEVPDLLKSAVITAGFQGNSPVDGINNAIFDGKGIKLRKAFAYARDNYYLGLPEGFPVNHINVNDPVLEALCEEYLAGIYVGHTVDVKTVSVAYSTNVDVKVRQYIETNYNYDFDEEAVHTAFGAVDVDASLEYAPLPPDPVSHAGETGYQLTFTNPDTSEEVLTFWLTTATAFTDADLLILNRAIMEVVIDTDPAITLSYADGGPSAVLNLYLRNRAHPTSSTYPAIVLKRKNKYIDTDDFLGVPWESSDAWQTSKVYADRMGVDINEVLKLVKDNPDENKIDYAFIQPGTLINSPNQAVINYHWRYFMRLYATLPDNKPAYDDWVAACSYPTVSSVSKNLAKNCPAQSYRIQDPDGDRDSLDFAIAWRYMEYQEVAGVLSDTYEIECGSQILVQARHRKGRSGYKTVTYDVTPFYIRKQLNDTTYAELKIVGLWHENYVYKNETVQSAVWDVFNDPEGDFGTGFLIPLEYTLLLELSGRNQLQLAEEAYHIVFNCYKVVKEKWYQTGIFKIVMAIVAIVIIVYSWGTLTAQISSLYSTVYATVAAAVGAGVSSTVVAAIAASITALIVVGVSIGVTTLAGMAGRWAAEHWGAAWGAIVQIAATVVLMYGIGVGMKSMGMNIPPTSLPESVINIAGMTISAMSTYTEAQYAELQESMKKWNDYIANPQNPMEELERMIETFLPESYMQTLAQDALFGPKESLDQFLGRTLTSVDGLTYRLTLPINYLSEITLTPRLI